MRTKEEIIKEMKSLEPVSRLKDFRLGENDVLNAISDSPYRQKISYTQKAIESEREALQFAEPNKSKEYYLGYINTLEWVLEKRNSVT